MNGICAIVNDMRRQDAPRMSSRPAPTRDRLLRWLSVYTLSARELAERAGVDYSIAKVVLHNLCKDRLVYIAYRRVESVEDRRGPGRKRHLVNCYRARPI